MEHEVFLIHLYKKYLTKLKGFCGAYGILHSGNSSSAEVISKAYADDEMTNITSQLTLNDVQQLIDSETEESLNLDYKGADSLGKSEGKKKEISKDVSAMANAAGGRIIYGVAEYQENDKKHLPEKLDPIEVTDISKEWLEQIINSNISPKIANLVISPIAIDSSKMIYVVDIPQSDKGHQARDKRYYKRFNFESVPMEDYELKDILNRRESPSFDVQFDFSHDEHDDSIYIVMRMRNTSTVFANYVCVHVYIPSERISEEYIQVPENPDDYRVVDGTVYFKRVITNKESVYNYSYEGSYPRTNKVATYYEPVLPGLSMTGDIAMSDSIHQDCIKIPILYEIYVDSTEPTFGTAELTTHGNSSTSE